MMLSRSDGQSLGDKRGGRPPEPPLGVRDQTLIEGPQLLERDLGDVMNHVQQSHAGAVADRQIEGPF